MEQKEADTMYNIYKGVRGENNRSREGSTDSH